MVIALRSMSAMRLVAEVAAGHRAAMQKHARRAPVIEKMEATWLLQRMASWSPRATEWFASSILVKSPRCSFNVRTALASVEHIIGADTCIDGAQFVSGRRQVLGPDGINSKRLLSCTLAIFHMMHRGSVYDNFRSNSREADSRSAIAHLFARLLLSSSA